MTVGFRMRADAPTRPPAEGMLVVAGVLTLSRAVGLPGAGSHTPDDSVPAHVPRRKPIRSVERLTGVHHATIIDLVVSVGQKCQRFLSRVLRNIKCRDVQLAMNSSCQRHQISQAPSYSWNGLNVPISLPWASY